MEALKELAANRMLVKMLVKDTTTVNQLKPSKISRIRVSLEEILALTLPISKPIRRTVSGG